MSAHDNNGASGSYMHRDHPNGLRFASKRAKISYFIGGYVGILVISVACWKALHFNTATVIYLVLFVAWATIAARCFRGKAESVSGRRPWWKLTAQPAAGWVMTGLLLSQVLVLVASAIGDSVATAKLAIAFVYLVFAGLLIHSSTRLHRDRRH